MDDPHPEIPTQSVAVRVLTDRFYFQMITEFQVGLPKLVRDFALQRYKDWNTMPEAHRHQRLRLLGIEVIKHGDLRLLEVISRVQYRESVGLQTVTRQVALPLQHTVTSHRPDMLRWIVENNRDPYPHIRGLWNDTFVNFHGDFAVLEQLKALMPLGREEFDDEELQTTLTFHLLDLKLLQWTCDNLPSITIPKRLMGEAAYTGNLSVVAFLHEKYPTHHFRRDIYCRAWAGSSFEVLEYLLKHRPEPYSDRFLERVVDSGCVDVLKMVHRYRGLRVKPRFIELASTCGHTAIQSYLVTRTVL